MKVLQFSDAQRGAECDRAGYSHYARSSRAVLGDRLTSLDTAVKNQLRPANAALLVVAAGDGRCGGCGQIGSGKELSSWSPWYPCNGSAIPGHTQDMHMEQGDVSRVWCIGYKSIERDVNVMKVYDHVIRRWRGGINVSRASSRRHNNTGSWFEGGDE